MKPDEEIRRAVAEVVAQPLIKAEAMDSVSFAKIRSRAMEILHERGVLNHEGWVALEVHAAIDAAIALEAVAALALRRKP